MRTVKRTIPRRSVKNPTSKGPRRITIDPVERKFSPVEAPRTRPSRLGPKPGGIPRLPSTRKGSSGGTPKRRPGRS